MITSSNGFNIHNSGSSAAFSSWEMKSYALRLNASPMIPIEEVHIPATGTNSRKKCSHLLLENATPSTCDQKIIVY